MGSKQIKQIPLSSHNATDAYRAELSKQALGLVRGFRDVDHY